MRPAGQGNDVDGPAGESEGEGDCAGAFTHAGVVEEEEGTSAGEVVDEVGVPPVRGAAEGGRRWMDRDGGGRRCGRG